MRQIDLKNISLSFSDGKDRKVIFDDYSYTFKEGLYSISGKSGCGKTTLLNVIGGRIRPLKGTVLFDSVNVDIIPEKNKDLLYVELLPPSSFTIFEAYLLLLRSYYQNLDQAKSVIENKLADTAVIQMKKRKLNTLSNGERKMVAIYLTRLIDKGFYLLDEPFAGLSGTALKTVEEEMISLSKTKTLILTLHPQDSQDSFLDCTTRIKL